MISKTKDFLYNSVDLIAHSRVPINKNYNQDADLLSFKITFPRPILPQFKYGRICFNSSSNRAIPRDLVRDAVTSNPYYPIWTINAKGMSGKEAVSEDEKILNDIWNDALDYALKVHEKLSQFGAHKQNANRILEPFSYVSIIATGDMEAWQNLINQRMHHAAQPEFQIIATAIHDKIKNSIPIKKTEGEAHIPFYNELKYSDDIAIKAIKRIFRVSYDKSDEVLTDLDEIVNSIKPHIKEGHESPLEHIAYPSIFIKQYTRYKTRFNSYIPERSLRKIKVLYD